jgi:phosphate transport system substrate-binding protein
MRRPQEAGDHEGIPMDRRRGNGADPHGVTLMTASLGSIRFPRSVWHAGILAAALTAGLTAWSATARADDVTLTQTGSTLLSPVFSVWASEYMKTHPGVRITTGSTGSEAGIDQAISGKVNIGTSDAYMMDPQAKKYPHIINVPLAISAMTVNYNLPGLDNVKLKLDGPALVGIYTGKIRAWDDKPIAALNPGVALPHKDIIPIHRADGSGDTFVFTQYLTFSTPAWENTLGYATSINWPAVPGAISADGNMGVVQALQQTPYSIGYVGVSFRSDLEKAKLGTALLKSYSGEFLAPTAETIAASAAALTPRTPADQRLSLVNAPGANAYPLVNYEYAIVSTKQESQEAAKAIRKFLLWAIAPTETNEKYLEDAHFIALPAHIWVMSHDQIQTIK